MKANKDGTFSPEPFARKHEAPEAAEQPKPSAPWEHGTCNLLKSLKYKMSTRKEEIFVNSKDTNREGASASRQTSTNFQQFAPARPVANIAPKPTGVVPTANSCLPVQPHTVILTGGTLIPMNTGPNMVSPTDVMGKPMQSYVLIATTGPPRAPAQFIAGVPAKPVAPGGPPSTPTADTRRRVYECHYASCGKNYFKSSHLKAHMRTHTGKLSISQTEVKWAVSKICFEII